MTASHDGMSWKDGAALGLMVAAAAEAGALILEAFGGTLGYETKRDASPVTASDRAAEAVIARHLGEAFPGLAVVAEEAVSEGHVPPDLAGRFLLVDPLDGTREFVAGLPDFTVNIALVEDDRPLLGVVFAPAHDEIFVGSPQGAFKARMQRNGRFSPFRPIATRARPPQPLALASRAHRTPQTNLYLDRYDLEAVIPLGSSLKFCRIAEGSADLYPCLGRTMEWDTAAGQAVLEAAGGHVFRIEGGDLAYGKRGRADVADFVNPHFLATGSGTLPVD